MKYMPSRYSLFNELEDLFNNQFMKAEAVTMKTDVRRTGDSYILDIELPGYSKEDIKLSLDNGYLNIAAKHEVSNEEKNDQGQIVRQERSFGSCQRAFYVGDYLKSEDIKAKFNNGVLTICLPTEESKPLTAKENILIE